MQTALIGMTRSRRIVVTDHVVFVLINVYVPNAHEPGRLAYKLRFLDALGRRCVRLIASGRQVRSPRIYLLLSRKIHVIAEMWVCEILTASPIMRNLQDHKGKTLQAS